MDEKEIKIIIGSLLHDIGKVIYRDGQDKRNHSSSGYEYLKDTIKIEDTDILNCVRYHHGYALKNGNILDNSIAYIVYMADNIAAASDRRKKDDAEFGFEIYRPFEPVFNILNKNDKKYFYEPQILNYESNINYPVKDNNFFSKDLYSDIIDNITANLKGIVFNYDYLNSIMEVMEANLSFIPSSTANDELADISLYEHVKLTAAIACCIYQFMEERNITDYKDYLFDNGMKFYDEEAFLLASIDLSGIQNFIYTITTKNALKTLRSRSFYLEMLMEHTVDSLLKKIHLTRANLVYAGGGHAYILMPNTNRCKNAFDEFMDEINDWLFDQFKISLYLASGYVSCSCNKLKNEPVGSYSELHKSLSNKLSFKKSNRYSAKQIRYMNDKKITDYSRECNVCKNIGNVNDEGKCKFCESIENFSKSILYADFFSISLDDNIDGVALPGGCFVVPDTEKTLKERMDRDDFIRAYGKNKMYSGKHIASKLWVGSYSTGSTFEEFATEATGINRIGVLRADVDNLGQSFVAGFNDENNNDRYSTITRTAELSRHLSLFFKFYINKVLNNPTYIIGDKKKEGRNAAIVYSGGDDLFIVGSWNEIIGLAIDIRHEFERYTEGSLTLSAGIGIYNSNYPISVIADEVAEAESKSKEYSGKNAITIFDNKTYSWNEFEEKVLGEKYLTIKEFFDENKDYGKGFLYNLFELLRNQREKINFARYVYLLARMEPEMDADESIKQKYRLFSSKMLEWIHNEEDINQLETAIIIYVYLIREEEE